MILSKYLCKEISKSLLVILSILLAIALSRELILVLSRAIEGRYPIGIIFKIILFSLPEILMILLPLSFFLSILLSYSRMYADNEITSIICAGISPFYKTKIVLYLALFIAFLAAYMSLSINPLTRKLQQELIKTSNASLGASLIKPGVFLNVLGDDNIIFIQDIDSKNSLMSNVFVINKKQTQQFNQQNNEFSLLTSKNGIIYSSDKNEAILILEDGTRWEGKIGNKDYEKADFAKYQFKIANQEKLLDQKSLDKIGLFELLKNLDKESFIELQWRLAVPFSIIILALIATPLSKVHSRDGKFAKFAPAMLIFLIYYILIISGFEALEEGKTPYFLGIWWVHLLALSFAFFLHFRQSSNYLRLRHKILKKIKKL